MKSAREGDPALLEAQKDGKVRGEAGNVAEGETSKGNADKGLFW